MGTGFTEAPLALFTTLAPMAAASFIVLAYAFMVGKPTAEEVRRLDRWTAVPAAVMLAAIVAAFFHLANPLAAAGVFAGVGRSPLSNELLVVVLFSLVALVYWLLGLAGKLPAQGGARAGLLVVLAIGSVVLACACGMAYLIPTVPTWDNLLSVVAMVGYALVGGAALGAVVCAGARVTLPKSAPMLAAALAAVGLVLALAAWAGQMTGLSAMVNVWGPASALVPDLGLMVGLFALCAVACAVLLFLGKKGIGGAAGASTTGAASAAPRVVALPVFAVAAVVLAAVGIFVLRVAFYGLYMGIAL